jgi:methionyl-tRNA synthetase
MKMATSYGVIFTEEDIKFHEGNKNNSLIYKTFLEQSNANLSLQDVMKTYVRAIDEQIQRDEPFKVYKVDEEKAKVMVKHLLSKLYQLGSVLSVFMPQTSAKIFECISENKMPEKALFNRLS